MTELYDRIAVGDERLPLGKLPAQPARPQLRARRFLNTAVLPDPPAQVDNLDRVRVWPMYGNDNWGCCLVEGTPVQADGVKRAYRVRYDGPALRLEFASGRVLTVTPNHAVLTPRGFVRARHLQQGDYAVRALRPQMLEGGEHFNQAPARVEEVFTALSRRGPVARQRTKPTSATGPDDFHGDARFFDGDVDVVDAFGLLEGQLNAALGEPYGKREVLAAGHLERGLHGLRTALQAAPVDCRVAQRGIGRLGDLRPLGGRHAGVAHADSLGGRSYRTAGLDKQAAESLLPQTRLSGQRHPALPGVVAIEERQQSGDLRIAAGKGGTYAIQARRGLVASVLHPSHEGGPTDAELATDLLEGFPGAVEADRLVNIHEQRFHGYVYDLSTDRRWYVANEIVVHNCVLAEIGHHEQQISLYGQGVEVRVTNQDVLGGYSAVTGFDPNAGPPGNNPTDQGTYIQDALAWWRKTGIASHQILSYASIDPADVRLIRQCIALLGAVSIGFNFPASAWDQFDDGVPWDVVAGSPLEGGHCVMVGAYGPDWWDNVTWGRRQRMTLRFWQRYVDEVWVVIDDEMADLLTGRTAFAGVDLWTLGQDFTALTGEPSPIPAAPQPQLEHATAADRTLRSTLGDKWIDSNAICARKQRQASRAWRAAKDWT